MWQATVHGSHKKSDTTKRAHTSTHKPQMARWLQPPGENLLELTWASRNESPQFLPLQIAHWKICHSGSVQEFPLNLWPLGC